jgi:hypothetical protein
MSQQALRKKIDLMRIKKINQPERKAYSPRQLSATMNFLKSNFPSASCCSVRLTQGHENCSSITCGYNRSQSLSKGTSFSSLSTCARFSADEGADPLFTDAALLFPKPRTLSGPTMRHHPNWSRLATILTQP